jgi:hypothetical protein
MQPNGQNVSPDEKKSLKMDYLISGLAYDIDRWYSFVADLTPKTFFLDLTLSEINAIKSFYRTEFCSHIPETEELENIKTNLTSISLRMDEIFRDNPNETGWFVRLSCRSPKDGVPVRRAISVVEMALSRGHTHIDMSDAKFANTLMADIFRSSASTLQIFNSFEALQLICTSERVFRDLNATTNHSLLSKVSIREFNPKIDDMWEFRCFVYQKV